MENEEDGTTAAAPEGMIRIFVGGIGEHVTEEDMVQHIFRDSLGKVQSVEFIRTKGRSFAYLDFLPSSPKSLPKLFSTYNGCVWKGGKLKLEKAKEDYLVRLKKEGEEEAKLVHAAPSSGVVPDDKSIASLQMSKKFLKSEQPRLQVFFPKLQKVVSLPFSGTGKHKYSFQRVEERSLPIHFCDCEEHYVPPHKAKEISSHDLEKQSFEVKEEELNLMNSVMNKLFKKDNNLKEENAAKSVNNPQDDNEATEEEDEDGLVINMVTRGGKRTTISAIPEKITTEKKETKFKRPRVYKDDPVRDVVKAHQREVESSYNKRENLVSNGNNRNGSVSSIPKKQGDFNTTHAHDDVDLLLEPRTELSHSWSQKSSWKQLVGDKKNTGFCITHVLPGGTPREKEKEHKPTNENLTNDEDIIKVQDFSNHGNLGEQESDMAKELESFVAAEAQPSSNTVNNGRGSFWLQKSSWTQLVSETSNSFSISQILPGTTIIEETELAKPKILGVNNDPCSVSDKVQKNSNVLLAPQGTVENISNPFGVEQGTAEKKSVDFVKMNNEASRSGPKRTSIGDIAGSDGNFSFVRCAESMKDWEKTKDWLKKKSAPSRSAKRKHGDK